MRNLPSTAYMHVPKGLAERLFETARTLPLYKNTHYYDPAVQDEVFTSIRSRCVSEFDELMGDGENTMLLVRPDRFCMAVFNAGTAREKLNTAAKLLGLQGN